MNFRFCTILLLVLISKTCLSQSFEEHNFFHYTTTQGLSNNYVTGIEQDAYGYLWIATYKGLNRFDGASFQKFYADSDQSSLPEEIIHRLAWLDEERLAAMTQLGLHIVNTRTLESYNLIIPQPPGKKLNLLNRVHDAAGDENGNTFISTITGFYQFNKKNELVFRYDHSLAKQKKGWVFGFNIIRLTENVILLSTFEGPYIYYVDRKDLHPVGKQDEPFYQQFSSFNNIITEIKGDKVSKVAVVPNEKEFLLFDFDHKSRYSIRTAFQADEKFDGGIGAAIVKLNDSVYVINSKETGFYLLRYHGATNSYDISEQGYFNNYMCTALFIDKHERLWIGTSEGLFFQKKAAAKIEQITISSSPSPRNAILSLAISNDKIFAGTNREGIYTFYRDDLRPFRQLNFSEFHINEYPNTIIGLIPIDKDTLQMATSGVWINTKNMTRGITRLSHLDSTYRGIQLLFKDSRANVYLQKAMQNIFFIKPKDGKFIKADYSKELSPIGIVTSMAEDPEGNIWFVSNGLVRFNTALKKFDWRIDSFPKGVKSNTVSSNLVFDRSGKMYFGLWEGGLIIYDPVKKTFSRFTRNDGLPDNIIRSVFLHNNTLWMGTESGLSSYDLSTKKIFSFGSPDGIPTDPYNTFLLRYDSAGHKLYGAFKSIIFRFDPDSLAKNNQPPDFAIENLVIAGKKLVSHPPGDIELSYRDNSIVLNLSAVNFEDPFQQQIAYRFVKNGNEPWIEIGAQRSIIFENLPATGHRIQLKLYSRDSNWAEQVKEIFIRVRPPFWKTWWFYACCAVVLASILLFIHKRRIFQVQQKANLDKQLAQTEMKALQSQMNPHFIFNCLNSIREMILNDENSEASHYLSKFAQLIRITLNHSSKQFITLQNTMDYLHRYLEMEQIRTDNFTYTMELEDDLNPDEIFLPPMVIQPFIENAIWHGAVSNGEPVNLIIRFYRRNQHLVCMIEDNGVGIIASLKNKSDQATIPGMSHHQSLAIENTRQRIRVLNEKYNLNSSLVIEDKSRLNGGRESGTLVTLEFPIKNVEI